MLAAAWLSSMTVLAGSFTTDFSNANGYSLQYDSTLFTSAVVYSNRLVLTPPLGSQAGGVVVQDFDNGQAIESFTASFKLQIGPASSPPADGVSFNFGASVLDSGTTVYNEEGPPTPNQVLTISFDTYDNSDLLWDQIAPAPSIDIIFGGNIIAHHHLNAADMATSQLEDVLITVTRAGMVSVSYKGQVIHTNVLVQAWAPVAGLFNISGRTGGAWAEQDIDDLTITTVLQGAVVAPSITADPVSATVNEESPVTFSVGVAGSAPFTFQWTKNGSDIPGATGATYTLAAAPYSDNNAQFACRVSNSASSATSGPATLTVIQDTTPPTVLSVNADTSGTHVIVSYSEPVTDTALTSSNYGIDDPTVSIVSVTRVDASRVSLLTTALPEGHLFTLTINGVQDMASSPPNTIANNTQVQFRSYVFASGAVLHKKYNNMNDASGWNLNNLWNDPRFPNFPDRQEIMPMFEYPLNGVYRDATADPVRNYYDTLEGYFTPAAEGDYVFYVTGGDMNNLYISTDADPANKYLVASLNGWTDPRHWNVAAGDAQNPPDARTNGLRSDYYTGNLWPGRGDPATGNALIHLQANTRYYMLSVHHDFSWSGADDFAVTYTLAGAAVPALDSAPALAGSQIGTYLDPSGANVSFAVQPADKSILQGRTATFTALATGRSVYGTNVTYQWQTADPGSTTFTDISGETKSWYTTPVMGLADSGRKYQVVASVPAASLASRAATLTVSVDNVPPALAGASASPSRTGSTFDVGVTFDEPVTQGPAETLANYSISSGSITAVKYYPSSPGVVLTVSGLTVGNTYTVTVANLADGYGNTMTSAANIQAKVSGLHWGVVGADELQLGNGVVAVGTNSFDVYSDGIGEWASYDEATFVYEQVTGNFDKEVRVEFQDASSTWARAGIIARDVPNFGVNRAAQEGGQAGRYQKLHVNPVLTTGGGAGNNSYEGNRRLTTGGATDNATLNGDLTPHYPNAWCRIQRVGQVFNLFNSSDGVTWTQVGSSTFTGMPDTLYVGPEFSPENGNIATAQQGMFVAKFRDYRTHSDAPVPPNMTWQRTPTGIMTITFEGTLQYATSLNGGWTDMADPSPHVVPAGGTQLFYRAKR